MSVSAEPISTHEPTAAAEARRRALEAYFNAVRQMAVADPHGTTPPAASPALNPWVQRQVLEFFCDERPANGEGVTVQALALLLKAADDLERMVELRGDADHERFSLRAELVIDAAVGMALVLETGQAIQTAIGRANHEAARGLNRIHHDLRREVDRLLSSIGETERRRAESLSVELSELSPAGVSPSRAVDCLPAESPQPPVARPTQTRSDAWRRVLERSRKEPRVDPWFPSRTELLLAALTLSALVWGVATSVSRLRPGPPPAIVRSDLVDADAIQAVRARPPSLFVTLHDDAWAALDSPSRERLVERLSAVLIETGYRGAMLSLENGRPVARWLEGSGHVLLEDAESHPTAVGQSGESSLEVVFESGARRSAPTFRLRVPARSSLGGAASPTD